jgi:NhaP-type Na+/H+ or K+/H+ antiporter
LISSTEIDIHSVANAGGASLRLTCLPGLVEAAVCAAASYGIFGMPIALASSLGFILAAVSPAIVVPGMTNLQRLGYGVEKGIPSLVMAACAFDDIVAITGFTICIGIAFDSHDNLALSAFLHGPAATFLGVLSGCVAGCILAASTRFCPHQWQRTALALELGLLLSWGFKLAGFNGSGAVS